MRQGNLLEPQLKDHLLINNTGIRPRVNEDGQGVRAIWKEEAAFGTEVSGFGEGTGQLSSPGSPQQLVSSGFCWTAEDAVSCCPTIEAEIGLAVALLFFQGEGGVTQLHGLRIPNLLTQ